MADHQCIQPVACLKVLNQYFPHGLKATICDLLMTTDFLNLPALRSDAEADIGWD